MDFWFLLIMESLLGMDLKCSHWPLMSIIKFWVQNSGSISLFTVYFWWHDHKQPDCFMDSPLSWANLKEGLVKPPLVYWVYKGCHSCLLLDILRPYSSVGFPDDSDGRESTRNAGDPGSIPGSGRSPGDVFLPGKLHARGAWWTIVHGVAKSQTQLNMREHAMHVYFPPIYSTETIFGKSQMTITRTICGLFSRLTFDELCRTW